MATVTLYEYAQIADQVYNDQTSFVLAGWVCQRFKMDKPFFKGGSLLSDGFQGGSFYKRETNQLVIGLKGTVPSMASDLMADLRIATQRIPNQADTAMTHVEQWRQVQPDATVSLVGHSLGGGLCQVVGSWLHLPFVTFNAPAMGTNWFLAHFNVVAPLTMARTILARRRNDGVNYRLLNDPVSKLGNHIGLVRKIDAGLGISEAHSMSQVVDIIARTPGLKDSDPFA